MMESQFSPGWWKSIWGCWRDLQHRRVVLFGFTGIKERNALKPGSPRWCAWHVHGFDQCCYDDEGGDYYPDAALYEKAIVISAILAYRTRTSPPANAVTKPIWRFAKAQPSLPWLPLPGLGMKQGWEQVASVLTPQTTALVCATDTLALGASKYLQEQRIPTSFAGRQRRQYPADESSAPGDHHRRSGLRRVRPSGRRTAD